MSVPVPVAPHVQVDEAESSAFLHEAAHVAGARGDIIAEFALDVLHRAGKIPR